MSFFLTGGNGRLGTELKKILDCIAPSSKEFDITKEDCIDYYLDSFRGDIQSVIHCAAFTDVPGAEKNNKDAVLTNIVGTKNISRWLGYYRIVYISTDYVYSGIKGDYKETDKTAPFNFYGFTKLAGETFMRPDKDLIIRTSFKPNTAWPYPKAFDDLYTSADYVDVIAQDIAMLAASDMVGIINVGTEKKSIHDLASRRNPSVGKMSRSEITNVNLPLDISMNLDKLNEFKKMEERSRWATMISQQPE